MEKDEANLPSSAKNILAIMRREVAIGHLTEAEAEFVRYSIRVSASLGMFGKFVVWFAGILTAMGVLYTAWHK